MKYQLKTRKSPLWKLMKIPFPGVNLNDVYVAFGRTIFLPPNTTGISNDLLVHEVTHLKQQNYSYIYATIFFVLYVISKEFRYKVELEAYRNQIKYIVDNKLVKGKNNIFNLKKLIAKTMEHPMYGGMCTFEQALKDLNENN